MWIPHCTGDNQRIRMPNRFPLFHLFLSYFIAFNLTIEAKHFLVETEDGSEMLTEEQTNAILGALPHQLKEEYESLDKATQQKLQRKLYKMLGEPDWERPLSKADSDELAKRVRICHYTVAVVVCYNYLRNKSFSD